MAQQIRKLTIKKVDQILLEESIHEYCNEVDRKR